MKKNIVKLTESELKCIVENAVKKIITNEGFIDKVTNYLEDVTRGYAFKEGNPSSIEDVFSGDGWKVCAVKEKNNGYTYYAVRKIKDAWKIHNGIPAEEMVDELNIFLEDKGLQPTAEYVGTHPSADYIDIFRVKTI